MILYGFFRSSAAYRVRIALNLKGVGFSTVSRHLRRGEQRAPDYLTVNPQGLVPALDTEEGLLTQSMAICEYLEETHPQPPLLPADPRMRARVRAFCQVIACEIHPLQNLKVLNRLRETGLDQAAVDAWAIGVIDEGLEACSKLIADYPGPCCFGREVTLADVFLVPQMANARRFGARLDWPRLAEIDEACRALPAFQAAAPELQPDAE